MKNTEPAPSGIILFAKQSGKTSFSSLFTVKHALNTKKVGHTGTLDSFAQGLLVVLSGGMTRLVPYITAFDKEYEAVICFGAETDTLDPNGIVLRTAPLPSAATLTGVVARFRGELDQKPPLYSAVHVDGKRASDIARKGGPVDIPSRKVTVYASEILEMRSEEGDVIPPFDISAATELVKYARIRFHVSKGTYIRSLARDIADACGSAAHLEGLLRTKVGSFSLEDAAGHDLLKPFSIDSVLAENAELAQEQEARRKALEAGEKPSRQHDEEEGLRKQVRESMKAMSPSVAKECGLTPVTLKKESEKAYFNGRPLSAGMFEELEILENNGVTAAVFTESGTFSGVITVNGKRISYQYVVSREQDAPKPVKTGEVQAVQTDLFGNMISDGAESSAASDGDDTAASAAVGVAAIQMENDAVMDDDDAQGAQADLFEYNASEHDSSAQAPSDNDTPPESAAPSPSDMRMFTWDDIMGAYRGENDEVRSYFKEGSALTIGGFDGPHAGHLKLFDAVLAYAQKAEAEEGRRVRKGVVTFRQPPHSVTSPHAFSGDISTLPLKTDLFTLKGFDFVIVIDFSSDFSRMKGNDFLSILKDCCSMQFAAAGVDFRCGHQLDTGVAELSAFARQNDFKFQVIDDVTYNGIRISSSLIRTCVQAGRLHEAEMLLGRPYTVDVRNVAGEIRNEPCCLLQIAHGDVHQILPPDGEYRVKITSAGARTCNTVLHVDSSLLRLEIPPEWANAGIEKIEFTTLVS